MKIQFLISTMNRNNFSFLFNIFPKSLIYNINAIVVNQCTKIGTNDILDTFDNPNIKIFSVNDIGLSKSRNLALSNADADICVVCDDDYIYTDNCLEIINEAYSKLPFADIVTFQSLNIENDKPRKIYKYSIYKHSIFDLSSISSSEITFKLEPIKKNKLFFDDNYGLGSPNLSGEDGIFLMDSYRKGLRIYHYPEFILSTTQNSTGYILIDNPLTRGRIFRRLYPNFLIFLLVIFGSSVRKYPYYKNKFSFFCYFANLYKGGKK